MIRVFAILTTVLAALLAPVGAGAQELTPSHRAEIQKLMELTGAERIGNQMGTMIVQQVYAGLRRSNPNLPADSIAILEGVTVGLLTERSGELLERVVPLYGKHFSEAEIVELVSFYESPIGQKAIRVLPVIMQEMAPLSQAWATELQPELEKRLKARLSEAGYL